MFEENKALVQRWFAEVWNHGSSDAVDQLMSADAVVHGLGEPMTGPEGFKRFHAAYREAFPDVQVEVQDLIAEGDKVAFRWIATATHRGGSLGFAATNRNVRFEGMGIIRVRRGKLVEGWNTFDQLGMLQQLGVVPK